MDIVALLSAVTLEEIVAIEERDLQFEVLRDAWLRVVSTYPQYAHLGSFAEMQSFFLLLIVKNALISYQIAGS